VALAVTTRGGERIEPPLPTIMLWTCGAAEDVAAAGCPRAWRSPAECVNGAASAPLPWSAVAARIAT
jgi:hypothetical protein